MRGYLTLGALYFWVFLGVTGESLELECFINCLQIRHGDN